MHGRLLALSRLIASQQISERLRIRSVQESRTTQRETVPCFLHNAIEKIRQEQTREKDYLSAFIKEKK